MQKILFWRTMSLFGMWIAVLVSFLLEYNIGGPFAAIFAISYIFLSVITNFTRATFRPVERIKNHIIDVIMDRLGLIRPMAKLKDRINTVSVLLAMFVAGGYIPSVVKIFFGSINILSEVFVAGFFIIFVFFILPLPATERWARKIGKKIRDKDELKRRRQDIPLRRV